MRKLRIYRYRNAPWYLNSSAGIHVFLGRFIGRFEWMTYSRWRIGDCADRDDFFRIQLWRIHIVLHWKRSTTNQETPNG